ncbi:MAG: single-stranded DNA-binding protein [Sphaerochaetaceae bacterium]|nr:single-stranded DNA-binding protein [Sphaerochaetaceae bacterium]MDD3670312.1 single-stranded DNA-binding protein [Sphaerochaetaceae bacterium]MDD4259390.1 single-stranded DNA-binding protein [Sphaerochaetaceae bacterium]MDD4842134.1 single-stranded DNA-binding protein [Sphaerochaetaceae bacterium]
MANDINVVVLVGRLTRDSELRFTNNGTAICRFSLAVNRLKRSGDQREEEVSYIDIVVWGKQAETLNPYLVKGRQICVNGELRQSRWEQDGQSRNKIEVVANNIELLGGSGTSASESNGNYQRNQAPVSDNSPGRKGPAYAPPVNDFPGPEQFDDDIPF